MVNNQKYPRRIRNALIVHYMASIGLILAVLGVSLYLLTKRQLDYEMGKRLTAIATLVASDLPAWLLPQLPAGGDATNSLELLRKRLLRATVTGQVRRAYLADLKDHAIVDTDAAVGWGALYHEHQFYEREVSRARRGGLAHTTLFRGGDGRYYKRGFAPVTHDGQVVAVLGVEASADFFASLKRMRRYLFISLFAISLLVVAVSIGIAERLVHPISQLAQAARRIGTGDLETPVTLPYRNELGLLSAAVDDMRCDLKEKDDRMKAMLQGIAHEIRNPLGGIELFAGLLREEIPENKREQRLSVRRIQNEVENLKLTVEQFLDFARDPAPQPERVEARALVEEVLASVRLAAADKRIQLQGECAADADGLWGDRRLLKAALMNLAQNALQAIPPGAAGQVELKVRRQALDGRGGHCLEVRDTGCGIAADELPHLFQPFFTTKERGCGLGLAFCQKIVHSHGGDITVDSIPGRGTTVAIWLPEGPEAGPNAPAKFRPGAA